MTTEMYRQRLREARTMLGQVWPECPSDMVDRMAEDLAIGHAQDRVLQVPLTERHVQQFRQHWEARWREWMVRDPKGVSPSVRDYCGRYLH
jgi:hypothetical protein